MSTPHKNLMNGPTRNPIAAIKGLFGVAENQPTSFILDLRADGVKSISTGSTASTLVDTNGNAHK